MVKKNNIVDGVIVNLIVLVGLGFIGIMIVLGTMLFEQNKNMVLMNFNDEVIEVNNRIDVLSNMVSEYDFGHSDNEYR